MTLKDKIAKARELGTRFSDRNVLGVVDALEKCLEYIKNTSHDFQNFKGSHLWVHKNEEDCRMCIILRELEPSEALTKERE